MARGDTQQSNLSRGGYGRYHHYDDEGRGDSKWLWDEFESHFKVSGYSKKWLMGTEVKGVDPTLHKLFTDTEVNRFFQADRKSLLEHGLYDGRLYCYIQNMRDRYGVHDWAWNSFTDDEDNDGRVRRLVVQKLGVKTWQELQKRAEDVYHNIDQQKKEEQAEKAEENAQAQAVFKAEQTRRDQDKVTTIKKETDLIAGAIRSEFHQAFSTEEAHNQEQGDWLDDPIEGVMTGYGFGEEIKGSSGVKLQVTVSLDLSNSMKHNGVSDTASRSFRDIYLALEEIRKENPNDLYINAFTFSHNGYRTSNRGRVAVSLGMKSVWDEDKRKHVMVPRESSDSHLGAVEYFKETGRYNHFTGEDTWFYPLFEEIEKWENKSSEAGAVKLDIIITDAVIEHPSDIRRSDVIQERRNGNLQTVMLNFLPDSEWADTDLPSGCVQYAANPENIAGLLRNILTEFVSVNL